MLADHQRFEGTHLIVVPSGAPHVEQGWPFMSNFSQLLAAGPTGGHAASLLDMALYHGDHLGSIVSRTETLSTLSKIQRSLKKS